MSNKFNCFLIGEESLLLQCSEILLNKGHKILGIFSSNKTIAKWASENEINLFQPDFSLINVFIAQPFDYLFSITNLSVLPENIVNSPSRMAINFHDGPLPKYAGINATSWALMDRVKKYGITWHEITNEIDKGDILKQVMFDVDEEENALSLNAKCFQAAATSFEELVDDLAKNSFIRTKQNYSERTYFGKFKRPNNAALIKWDQDARKILAFVRALNFVRYKNPLGLPKIKIHNEYFLIPELEETNIKSTQNPGSISEINENFILISTNTQDLKVVKIFSVEGKELKIKELTEKFSLTKGSVCDVLSNGLSTRLSGFNSQLARKEEYWIKELSEYKVIDIHYAKRNAQKNMEFEQVELNLKPEVTKLIESFNTKSNLTLVALFGIFIGRHSGKDSFTLGLSSEQLLKDVAEFDNLFSNSVPVNISFNGNDEFESTISFNRDKIDKAIAAKTFVKDVFVRYPVLNNFIERISDYIYPVSVFIGESKKLKIESLLTLSFTNKLEDSKLIFDSSVISKENVELLKNQFICFIEEVLNNPLVSVSSVSLLSPVERKKMFDEWNNTKTDFQHDKTIHEQFEIQAEKTPENEAVYCKGKSLTYGELNKRSNQLAKKLRKLGVKSETLVGISLYRSVDMMVAILGILKAGGAYVPLDPDFPRERIHYMIQDSKCPVIITEERLKSNLAPSTAEILFIDSGWKEIAKENKDSIENIAISKNLAYVIYTSGSTGKPKGVMVEHRNVVNFFTGMDKKIKFDPPGVWLAVTSLSFDISVLELLWTLTHGFKVVIYAEEDWKNEHIKYSQTESIKKIDFSLFYFSSYENENPNNKYRLLIEGAKFADQNRFSAVWTPERHFHEFGGLYPNPSVTGAALATITEHVRIMSGSCVSPLHNPIRIAEEWSVVDNLSKGRVGISFAAGWQPNDFTLMPQNYDRRKDIMFEQIEIVRKLWRGETLQFEGPNGKNANIITLPRPVQKELPVWITAANNPETFQMAGERGFYLLTHLLGQSIEELAEKIFIYKQAWKKSGNGPGEGYVSLMLHTFVGENLAEVRETVREPMKQYLKSAASLVKLASWYFPTFDKMDESFNEAASNLSDDDMDVILNHSFERYFETSSLLGTPGTCKKTVEKLKIAGVDDVACLIDFGVDSEKVLSHLQYLNAVKTLANLGVRENNQNTEEQTYSIPELIRNQKVTHMQCTPSMAKMLLLEIDTQPALQGLEYMMIGGEAFPLNLAKQLSEVVRGNIINMYGPTETTIWSSTFNLNGIENSIPIGKPIANTEIFILDHFNQIAPTGVPGELCISGEGVVRGYFGKPELTNEKFIEYSLNSDSETTRLYRTGDLALINKEGIIEFLGRLDHQVKIRGYRIELGEIETSLEQHLQIREAVVIAREEKSGDKKLIAYVVNASRINPSDIELKKYLQEILPDYMIPSTFVFMDELPLTPNGKVDRNALPEPESVMQFDNNNFVEPKTETEKKIAALWSEVLGIEKISLTDNFFDLGGHSLSAVQINVKIHQTFNIELSLQDFFQSSELSVLATLVEEKLLELASANQLEQLLKEIEKK